MSATIIDSLLVTLGIDATKFTAGSVQARADIKKTTEESTTAAKQMEANGKQAAAFFSRIRNEALAMLAVFTGGVGIKNFVENTVTGASSLGRMSDNLGIGTQRLQAYQRAAEMAGTSQGAMTSALLDAQKKVSMQRMGQYDASMTAFGRFGGTKEDFADATTLLLKQADIISNEFKIDPGQAQLRAQMMGVSPEMFDMMKLGSAEMLKLVAAQEKHSGISRQAAEQLDHLRKSYLEFRNTISDTSDRILVTLTPTLEKVMGRLERMATYIEDHKDDIKKWIEDAMIWVTKFVRIVDKAAESVGGWKVVLATLLGLKVVSMVGPLLSLAAALVSIGSGLGAIGLAGPAALAALAGVGGYAIGSAINNHLSDETKDGIGEFIARTLASLGNKEAAEAILRNTGKDDYLVNTASDTHNTVAKLMAKGWTQEQAAGMAGSLYRESQLNPAAKNPTSGAYGIGQWLGTRVQDFKNFSGKDLVGSSFDDQLDFMHYELTKGKEQSAGRQIRATKTASGAARAHGDSFERPFKKDTPLSEIDADLAQRAAYANSILSKSQLDNASSAAKLPTGARSNAPRGGNSNVSTSETNINGPITIQTAATDAAGIAKSIGPALGRYGYVAQANTGMS